MVLNYIFVGCPWVVGRTVEDQLKETTIEASKTGKGFINVKLWKWWGYRFAELGFRVGFRDRIFKLDFELGSPGCRRLFSARFPVSVYGLPRGPKGWLRMGLRPTLETSTPHSIVPLGTRCFSLACGGNFRCWPKAEREKSSGTQGRVRIEEGDTYLPS